MSSGTNENGSRNRTYWDPTYLTQSGLISKRKDASPLYAVIVVNQPIENKRQLLDLCNGAKAIVYADGGANQIFHLAKTDEEQRILFPAAICGDLDSIEPEVEEWYASKHVAIVRDPDQYSTDLTKSLKLVKSIAHDWSLSTDDNASKSSVVAEDVLNAVVVGGIGGRFDQGFSQLHHLYTASEDMSSFGGRLFLANPQSICFLLHKGLNHVQTPIGPGYFGECVGIIPIGRPSVISTKGLEWDLDGQLTEFGGLLSTSNHIKRRWIEIETSERVLLTIELDPSRPSSR
ncbi:MAG: hypothetical protein LQ343_005733 [Gyalolechia ehrenbergii]|nr:MAG: hypothetical protein LQ343_005733 [Gyalolechia ehrenbergii]